MVFSILVALSVIVNTQHQDHLRKSKLAQQAIEELSHRACTIALSRRNIGRKPSYDLGRYAHRDCNMDIQFSFHASTNLLYAFSLPVWWSIP